MKERIHAEKSHFGAIDNEPTKLIENTNINSENNNTLR